MNRDREAAAGKEEERVDRDRVLDHVKENRIVSIEIIIVKRNRDEQVK